MPGARFAAEQIERPEGVFKVGQHESPAGQLQLIQPQWMK